MGPRTTTPVNVSQNFADSAGAFSVRVVITVRLSSSPRIDCVTERIKGPHLVPLR